VVIFLTHVCCTASVHRLLLASLVSDRQACYSMPTAASCSRPAWPCCLLHLKALTLLPAPCSQSCAVRGFKYRKAGYSLLKCATYRKPHPPCGLLHVLCCNFRMVYCDLRRSKRNDICAWPLHTALYSQNLLPSDVPVAY